MRAAVYNRWLHTMGGGERHSCMAAAVLAGDRPVDLVTHRAVDRDELAARLNIDLSNVTLKVIPALPPNRFIAFTRDYDLFVNASFMSSQPSAARKSIMLVLFPSPIENTLWARIRRSAGMFLIKELLLAEYRDGFYDIQELGRGWFRYASDESTVRVRTPRNSGELEIDMICGNFRPAGLGAISASCRVGSRDIGTISIEPDEGKYVRWGLRVPAAMARDSTLDLDFRCNVYNPESALNEDDNRNIGLAVSDVAVATPRRRVYELLFRRLFPRLGLRLEGLPEYGSLDFLDSYQLMCPISEFSLRWMRHYWNREGPILYPPVAVTDYEPGQKDRVILSVGRFFGEGGHSKNHEFMIRSFGKMLRRGLAGWELHLAGNKGPRKVDEEYFDNLKRAAAGLPVTLHPDLSFDELKKLYARASIYWHASGYGENPNKNPVKFEHFGITTVEAMASGCVPVVINKGGQPELVSHGSDGLLWDSRRELIDMTSKLTRDPEMLQRLSQKAVRSASRFSEDRFRRHFLELVESIA